MSQRHAWGGFDPSTRQYSCSLCRQRSGLDDVTLNKPDCPGKCPHKNIAVAQKDKGAVMEFKCRDCSHQLTAKEYSAMFPTAPTQTEATMGLPAFDAVKSTGKPHTVFETGSRRDNRKGKGRFDLLSPIVMLRDAIHMENGAEKYEARNWEKGQPLSTFFDSAARHLYSFLAGNRDEDHLAAARWNIGAMMHVEEMIRRGNLPATLNDMPTHYAPKLGATA